LVGFNRRRLVPQVLPRHVRDESGTTMSGLPLDLREALAFALKSYK
jgi:hypothetical protein